MTERHGIPLPRRLSRPLAFAHRGGAEHPDLIGLENTLTAFRHAVDARLRLPRDRRPRDPRRGAAGLPRHGARPGDRPPWRRCERRHARGRTPGADRRRGADPDAGRALRRAARAHASTSTSSPTLRCRCWRRSSRSGTPATGSWSAPSRAAGSRVPPPDGWSGGHLGLSGGGGGLPRPPLARLADRLTGGRFAALAGPPPPWPADGDQRSASCVARTPPVSTSTHGPSTIPSR